MLNLFPYNPGHMMVAPKRHVRELSDLSDEEIKEMFHLIKICINALKKEADPEGFNIGLNIGKVAGAGFEGHIHFHIVPRWNGDTNFMPVIGNVRVVPEGIEKTFEKLKKYFEGKE
jgi:ATP adenylyltransferase